MFNTFEMLALCTSVGAMAFALYLLQLQGAFGPGTTQPAAVSAEPGLVLVDESPDAATDARAALVEAVSQSVESDGSLRDLVVDDVTRGTGPAVSAGDTVTVHYTGRLRNGQQFDNSYDRGQPFTFTVGDGQVIAGWERGIVGMRRGGERILVIPPELGYGADGYGPIPGNATLLFAIELISIE